MTTAQAVIFWGALFIAILAMALGIRTECVFKIRTKFLHERNGLDAYKRLPSFHDMVNNPRHWLLWTRPQWDKWLESRSFLDC
jgi:hypothetical protein